MPHGFSKVEDALEALAEGRVVIVVDDEERENEGDFIAAASTITPETVAFMLTHGRGQFCMPIMPDLAARLDLPPFVATLGMFGVARGLAVWLAERTTLAFPGGVTPDWVVTVGKTTVLNPGLWSLVVLAGLVAVLLHLTVFGRHLYAVGSNEATARLCGVDVRRTKLGVYTLSGLLTGWAGVLMFAHSNSGNPTLGEQLELDVITAVVIGGASLSGGRGTVVGALLGVAILGLIKNGVSLFNVPVEMQYILIGVLLLANVALGRRRRR